MKDSFLINTTKFKLCSSPIGLIISTLLANKAIVFIKKYLNLKRFPHISLHYKLLPVQLKY